MKNSLESTAHQTPTNHTFPLSVRTEMRSWRWRWCPPASQSRSLVTTESPRPSGAVAAAGIVERDSYSGKQEDVDGAGGRQSLGREVRAVEGDSSFDI